MKFQASTLDQCHHLHINLSCKSDCKPLNAISARSAAYLPSKYCSWARSHRSHHCDCASYPVFTRFGCTLPQHVQLKPSRDFALTEALTSEVGLLQNLRAFRKWIPFSSNFWAIIHVRSWRNRVFKRVWQMFGFLIIRKIFWAIFNLFRKTFLATLNLLGLIFLMRLC